MSRPNQPNELPLDPTWMAHLFVLLARGMALSVLTWGVRTRIGGGQYGLIPVLIAWATFGTGTLVAWDHPERRPDRAYLNDPRANHWLQTAFPLALLAQALIRTRDRSAGRPVHSLSGGDSFLFRWPVRLLAPGSRAAARGVVEPLALTALGLASWHWFNRPLGAWMMLGAGGTAVWQAAIELARERRRREVSDAEIDAGWSDDRPEQTHTVRPL